LLNAVLVVVLAMWPLSAIVVTTASVLVAARNFQSAWLMRSLGEDAYREWHVQRVRETRVTLHLFCLVGNTALTAVVGAALICVSQPLEVPFAIGMGMVAYAIAVAFYSLLAIWRIHRATKREARRLQALPNQRPAAGALVVETYSRPPDQIV
jgi:membrane protein implicated in regulation of membrane protease activity